VTGLVLMLALLTHGIQMEIADLITVITVTLTGIIGNGTIDTERVRERAKERVRGKERDIIIIMVRDMAAMVVEEG
jgi:hypothetical protein